MQVAFDESMTDFTEIGNVNAGTKISIDAPLLASTLTDMKVNKGATDVDFPMDIAVYIRLRAVMMTSDNKAIEGTEILSNVVSVSYTHLPLWCTSTAKQPMVGNSAVRKTGVRTIGELRKV